MIKKLVAIIFFFSNLCFANNYKDPILAEQILSRKDDDMFLGSVQAPITMIEYSSMSCFHCAHFHQNIFPTLKEKYIDTGKLLFIQRDFPFNKSAISASVLAHCADKSKYFVFLKILFEKQASWAYVKNPDEILYNIGKLGGMSEEKLNSCFKDENLNKAIVSKMFEAQNLLDKDNKQIINGTPTFFINSDVYSGDMNAEAFSKKIDEILDNQAK